MSAQKSNPALERRLQAYPPPKYHLLTKAYAQVNEMKDSETVSFIIKDFFDRMPEQERQRLIDKSRHHY